MDEYLFRDNPGYPLKLVKQKGSYSFDEKGNKLLDFMNGWCVGNSGWKNIEIQKALKRFSGPTYVAMDLYYQRWEELAKELVGLMPNRNYTCFRATGGTEAVEIALKIATVFNKRQKFIAFDGAYHGQSLKELALVGLHADKFGPYENNYIRLSTDWEKAKQIALDAIEKKEVCAFISEPIICNLMVVVPPKDFFTEIRKACTKTDTVFIMDEVATGFGRTGKFFGYEHYDIEPDIVTMGKGISSGHVPIGATVVEKSIAESMRFDFSNYSTFGWHPLGVESALANINFIKKNKLVEKSAKDGEYLKKKLGHLGRIEGEGLCLGLEVKKDNFAKDCLEDGLLLTKFGNRVLLFPPLTIKKSELNKAIKIIKKNY